MSGYLPVRMFINGEWITRDGADILNPSDGTVLGSVPHATRSDLDAAVAAATRGFATWRNMSPESRHEIIVRAVALLRERAEEIAAVISLEQGKPHAQARAEVLRGAELMIWDAEEGRRAYGRVIPSSAGWRNLVFKEPIGPVAAFTPWSAPTSAPGRKIGGALAAGCSIVLKASEETPGGAVQLVRCFEEAGLPPGIINLIFGVPSEVSEFLIAAPEIRLITFTGSVPVGIHLAGLAAQNMKPVIMELGGHSPVFVCADADAIAVARLAAAAKFRNAGQVCISPTRFFLHEAVHDTFVAEFSKAAAAVRLGGSNDPDAQMGPLANIRRVGAMRELVEDALSRGAKLTTGGRQPDRSGYFFEPTVLTDVPADALVMRSEPFGPIAAMRSWSDLDEAIEIANGLQYGLAAYAFSDSSATLDRIASRLEVGHLSINHFGGGVPESPFGGVKYSGIGREGGQEGLEGYFVTKYVSHRMHL